MADLNRVREDRFAAEKLRAELLKRARSAQATSIARRNMSIIIIIIAIFEET